MLAKFYKLTIIALGLGSPFIGSACWASAVPNAEMDIYVGASTSGGNGIVGFSDNESTEVTAPRSQGFITSGSGGDSAGVGYSSLIYNPQGPSLEGITSAYKDGNAGSGGTVQGTYTYYFTAAGPNDFNVDWSAVAAYAQSAVQSGYTYADDQEADFSVNDVTNGDDNIAVLNLVSEDGYYGADYSGGPSVQGLALSVVEAGSGSFVVNPGDVYSVQLFIQAALGLGAGQDGLATEGLTSYIDPLFAISADNTNASADSLVFSDGITQEDVTPNLTPLLVAPGVPEPSSWTMMLLGIGIIGCGVRSRSALRVA